MSPARAEAIGAWLRAAYDQLGMRDYEVTFEPDERPHEDGLASTWFADHAEVARVRVKADFWDEPADERRALLLHEVLHAPFQRLRQMPSETLEEALGKPAFHVFDRLWIHELERVVGKLERALAPLFPPIPDPDRPAPSEAPA